MERDLDDKSVTIMQLPDALPLFLLAMPHAAARHPRREDIKMGKEEMNTEKTKDKLSEAWDKTLQMTDAPKKSVNGSGEVDALHTNGAKASRPAQVVPTEEAPAPCRHRAPRGPAHSEGG